MDPFQKTCENNNNQNTKISILMIWVVKLGKIGLP